MRFRILALVLALAFSLTATMEARSKKPSKPKRTYKAQKYKPRKVKRARS